MKIAVTADIHISPDHPERLKSLEKLFTAAGKEKYETIIIAGDLFDKEKIDESFSGFNKLINEHPGISVIVIPGNHDFETKQKYFSSSDNFKLISKPEIVEIDSTPFLFIPYAETYTEEISMGKFIAQFKDLLPKEKWILVSHGDYISSKENSRGNEKISYFPLNREDIRRYNPSSVFLGHIHQHSAIDRTIYYPGSLYPVNSDETDLRHFIIYDTKKNSVGFNRFASDTVYLKEKINIIPVNDIKKYMNEKLKKLQKKWDDSGISKKILKNSILKIEINGFTNDKETISKIIEALKEELNLKDLSSDFENLSVSEKPELREITEKFVKLLDDLEYSPEDDFMPDKEEILLQGEKLIYS